MPIVREMAEKRRLGYLAQVRDILAVGWGVRGERRELMRAALGLAVDFRTWETLAEKQGLSDAQAVQLVTDMVVRAHAASSRRGPASGKTQVGRSRS